MPAAIFAGSAGQARHHDDPPDIHQLGETKCLAHHRVVAAPVIARRQLVARAIEGADLEPVVGYLGPEFLTTILIIKHFVQVDVRRRGSVAAGEFQCLDPSLRSRRQELIQGEVAQAVRDHPDFHGLTPLVHRHGLRA